MSVSFCVCTRMCTSLFTYNCVCGCVAFVCLYTNVHVTEFLRALVRSVYQRVRARICVPGRQGKYGVPNKTEFRDSTEV